MANHRRRRPTKQANPGHQMCKPWKWAGNAAGRRPARDLRRLQGEGRGPVHLTTTAART